MRVLLACLALLGGIVMMGAPGAAHAQATRTWVSGVGDDVNPCSRTAPCKTFAGAISKTAAGGEINCLDPGGYGTVTITKAITIDCTGTNASILASATNGINVNAGANDSVILRGLLINGAGVTLGLNGVNYLAGAKLVIADSRIINFSQTGVNAASSTDGSTVDIINTEIVNTTGGVLAKPQPGISLSLTMSNVQSVQNVYGARVENRAYVAITNSTLSGNLNNGLVVYSTTDPAIAWVENSKLLNNKLNGVATNGAAAYVRLAYSTVAGNVNGLNASEGGQIASTSPATNAVYGNQAMNDPTNTLPLK